MPDYVELPVWDAATDPESTGAYLAVRTTVFVRKRLIATVSTTRTREILRSFRSFETDTGLRLSLDIAKAADDHCTVTMVTGRTVVVRMSIADLMHQLGSDA